MSALICFFCIWMFKLIYFLVKNFSCAFSKINVLSLSLSLSRTRPVRHKDWFYGIELCIFWCVQHAFKTHSLRSTFMLTITVFVCGKKLSAANWLCFTPRLQQLYYWAAVGSSKYHGTIIIFITTLVYLKIRVFRLQMDWVLWYCGN